MVFSVPAITVAQQAMAVNPVIPVQSAAISSQAVCQPKCQTNSEVDRLLFATLLKQLEAAEAQSAAPPKAPAAQSAKTISTEQRLSELEHRLDRILEALE